MNREKWIALAEVAPTFNCQELDQPACVNVIGIASDEASFIELIRSACEEIGCCLVAVEDIEPWQQRIADWQPDDEVVADAARVCEETPFVFGTFFCFDE